MKIKYLFDGKVQVGKGGQFLLGYFSPRIDSGDSSCYAHMVYLGWFFICWGD